MPIYSSFLPIFVYGCVFVLVCACMCVSMCACMCVYVCACMCVYVCLYVCISLAAPDVCLLCLLMCLWLRQKECLLRAPGASPTGLFGEYIQSVNVISI